MENMYPRHVHTHVSLHDRTAAIEAGTAEVERRGSATAIATPNVVRGSSCGRA